MRLKKFISATERHAIENAIREAEKKTSGQIVPTVVASSSHYDWIGYRAALLGWLAALLLALFLHYFRPFLLDFWELQAFQISGVVMGWLLSRFRFGVRLLVPEQALAEEVNHAAYASFVRNGVMNTHDRTGVLIFVSLRERRVQILADSGIHEKVGSHFWDAEVKRIVEGIRAGKPAAGIVGAIQSIGERLHEHFPHRASSENELSNRLRTE
ncbi:MAG: TPM domain-containing protein [Bdellovibrionota bacterium]